MTSTIRQQVEELERQIQELEEKENEVSETISFPCNDALWRDVTIDFQVNPHGWDEMEGPVISTSPNGHYLWLIDKPSWLKVRAEFDRVFGT